MPTKIKAILREVVAFEEVVSTIPVSAAILCIVVRTVSTNVNRKVGQFIKEDMFMQH